MVAKSQVADTTALPSAFSENIMPKARPAVFGWAGTQFDWMRSASVILAEDAAADDTAGWAGIHFDWKRSAATILAEDAAFGWAGTRFDWKRSAAAILAEDAAADSDAASESEMD